MIAFFGMGLLGSNFVRALADRGERVRVWNRSPEKARSLVGEHIEAFADAAECARGATRVHLTLSDDAAVDAVLEAASAGFSKDVILIDHTTCSPAGTRDRAARWKSRGIAFQHAPVFMGPQNARESTGMMLASGDRAQFDALSPELGKMTGKLVYMGEAPERAASFKLFGNMFLMFLTTGLADVLALAKALDVPANEAVALFEQFNPAGTVGARAKRMIDADFGNASWELSMARKDARLMMEAAAHANVPLAVLPAIAAEMDRWIDRGHGSDDWTVVAKGALPTKP